MTQNINKQLLFLTSSEKNTRLLSNFRPSRWKWMLEKLITDEEETWGNRKPFLQKDNEDIIEKKTFGQQHYLGKMESKCSLIHRIRKKQIK